MAVHEDVPATDHETVAAASDRRRFLKGTLVGSAVASLVPGA